VLLGLIANAHAATSGSSTLFAVNSIFFAVPFTLLALSAFFVWAYARRTSSGIPQ
jgi:hypothetical protein